MSNETWGLSIGEWTALDTLFALAILILTAFGLLYQFWWKPKKMKPKIQQELKKKPQMPETPKKAPQKPVAPKKEPQKHVTPKPIPELSKSKEPTEYQGIRYEYPSESVSIGKEPFKVMKANQQTTNDEDEEEEIEPTIYEEELTLAPRRYYNVDLGYLKEGTIIIGSCFEKFNELFSFYIVDEDNMEYYKKRNKVKRSIYEGVKIDEDDDISIEIDYDDYYFIIFTALVQKNRRIVRYQFLVYESE